MTPAPGVFQLAAKEFDSFAATPKPNRQWVTDAETLLQKPRGSYPEGVIAPRPAFNVGRMTELQHLTNTPLRNRLYDLFKHADFHTVPGETFREERARVMRMWGHVRSLGLFENSISARTPEGRARYDALIESCGLVSHSLDIKMSVHYGLFGATVGLMGDEKQAEEWLPKIERCEMLGCFALTELGHGSNARGIETIAEYDVKAKQFIIHTPCEEAQKYWIGGAAITARWTTAFAQLYVNGVCHGIHPFLVRIRHDNGTLARGVFLADCGHKCGMNGVDNGRIWFDRVQIPHHHMLRRFSQVSVDGVYSSKFKSADERFGASLASLSGGRVSVASGALNNTKVGLTIAIRYAMSRKAFGPPEEPETLLMDYPGHQYRLIPPLASTVALQFIHNKLKQNWHQQKVGKDLHVWSSGFKAIITWHMMKTLQEAREACGGQGYKTENRIGELKSSHDVAVTYEGDNHILLQAVAKTMLPEFMRGVRKGNRFEGHFAYLNEATKLRDMDLKTVEVRDARFAQTVMRRREAAIFAKLASRIEKNIRGGMSSLDAFNESAVLVEEAGKAHTELLMTNILQDILSKLRQKGDKDIADMVALCGCLFLFSRIDNQAVFQRTGAISPQDADRVNQDILVLCKLLRPHAIDLVDSFGIPPHLLAPIAFDYVSHNNRSRL